MNDLRFDPDATGGDLFNSFTLKGFVDRFYANRPKTTINGNHSEKSRVHETYKLYADERAILARLRRLPAPMSEVVVKAVEEFGGVLPRSIFERLDINNGVWQPDVWKQELESHFLGTVKDLSLGPYGIHASEEALVMFHEVVMAKLKSLSTERPAQVVHEVEMGVDLVSDITRFFAFLQDEHVRFTVHGELFKTSEKRLADRFVPGIDPHSKEPSAHEVLDFIYRFCTAERLIHKTGERSYTISDKGAQWEKKSLIDKQQDLLRFSIEERHLAGDAFHQVRLRKYCIRYLKRLEPEQWYDAMFLPFIARNAYVAGMDPKTVEQFFTVRNQHSDKPSPLEDLQQMGWNLLLWVRRRLSLLGIVDLGLDSVGRPVAIRLSRMGAKLLGVLPQTSFRAGHSHLIVNPNFEIVLLPEGDEFELAHALDRFCIRKKHEVLYHYEITEESFKRGLRDGMKVSEMQNILSRHARSPLPQNIIFSIHEWAERAGVVWLEGMSLRSRHAGAIDRLFNAPKIASHVADRPSSDLLVLRHGTNLTDIRGVARELGLSIERP
ncbi:MAG: helicase-associated domain-containing protein [Planctomycetota bacterium]